MDGVVPGNGVAVFVGFLDQSILIIVLTLYTTTVAVVKTVKVIFSVVTSSLWLLLI